MVQSIEKSAYSADIVPWDLCLTYIDIVVQREKCPNTEFFLVRIFLYLDWIRRFTP